MVSVGTLAEQKQDVARVAEQLFGKPFNPNAIVQGRLTARFPGVATREKLTASIIGAVSLDGSEAALLTHRG